TLLVFRRHSGDESRCSLNVQIDGEGLLEARRVESPSDSWTIPGRIFDLRPIGGEPSLLIDSDAQVDTGHRCRIKLGSDLPPGRYVIRADWMDETREGYALLYQTIPGSVLSRTVNVIRSPEEAQ
ncbi:MAG: hypothetical protein AAF456_07740, partial [Planctomycetota bacterium]